MSAVVLTPPHTGNGTSDQLDPSARLEELSFKLADQALLTPEELSTLWQHKERIPELWGDTVDLQALAGDRFNLLFGAHLEAFKVDSALLGLLNFSVGTESTPEERGELLKSINSLLPSYEDVFEDHADLITRLRDAVYFDNREKIIPKEIAAEGWVLPSELQLGTDTSYLSERGGKPFSYFGAYTTSDGEISVAITKDGKSRIILSPTTLIAPEGTPAWQSVVLARGRERGITPELAAIWFAAGEMYAVAYQAPPHIQAKWDRLLTPLCETISQETFKKFAERIYFRAHGGSIGRDGALSHGDIQNLKEFLTWSATEYGVDFVRMGAIGHSARHTAGLGWAHSSNWSPQQATLFGPQFEMRKIQEVVDTVYRSALCNYGVAMLDAGNSSHLHSLTKTKNVTSAHLANYTPQKYRRDTDKFSAAVDSFKLDPTMQKADELAARHKDAIKSYLEVACRLAISENTVFVPAPSSSQATEFLAHAIAHLFQDEGATCEQVFSKSKKVVRQGIDATTSYEGSGSVKSALHYFQRLANAYTFTTLKEGATLPPGKDIVIIDDITTMGCTRDICAHLLAPFSPKSRAFLALGKSGR